jgi:hypothetical protein
MSSTATRRFKRKIDRDKKKGKLVTYTNPYGERELNLPSEEEVQEYISNKTKELRMTDPFDNLDEFFIKPVTPVTVDTFPHKELLEWKNEEHLKLMKNEKIK